MINYYKCVNSHESIKFDEFIHEDNFVFGQRKRLFYISEYIL